MYRLNRWPAARPAPVIDELLRWQEREERDVEALALLLQLRKQFFLRYLRVVDGRLVALAAQRTARLTLLAGFPYPKPRSNSLGPHPPDRRLTAPTCLYFHTLPQTTQALTILTRTRPRPHKIPPHKHYGHKRTPYQPPPSAAQQFELSPARGLLPAAKKEKI